MNCTAKNLLYVLYCGNCDKTYIGHTTDLRHRNSLHKNQILHAQYRKLQCSHHIFNCNPSNRNFKIMPFFKLKLNCPENERESKENYFINIFKPSLNPRT